MSAMTPRMPTFKTIAPLGAWRRMREISPSRGYLVAPLAHCCEEARLKYKSRFCPSVTKLSPAQPTPQFTHRVKDQTKTDQKVQCKGGVV